MASIYGSYSKQSRLRLDYIYTQNVSTNKTTFTINVYAEKPSEMGTHNYGYGDSKYTVSGKSGQQLINGNGNWEWGNTTQYLVASSTYEYTHNADGTGSCTLSASWYTGLSSSSVVGENMSVSGTVNLPTIPRASTPSVSGNLNMGSAATISVSRASSSFTHTLKYKFGNASGTIATGVGTSTSWTPPLTLANQIPNASSGTGTITCETYNGNTLIGTKTCSFTAVLPSSYKPSFTSVTATRVDNGVPAAWGIYVKTKSKCTLAINGAAGIYGSTIKSYSISGGGYSSTSSSFTTGTLNSSGTITFTATITDSRGRTASKTVSISVVDYSAPTISSITSQRCNSSGTLDDDGTYIKAKATMSYSSCSSKNSATLKVAYKKSTASSYGTATTLTSGTASVIGAGGIDINYTYDVKYTVTDAFQTVTIYDQVNTAFTTVDYRSGGKGIAFGKVAETDDLFECAFAALFNAGLEVKGQFKYTPVAISSNANLNSYTTPGNYYCAANSTVATLSNCPTTNAFALMVLKHAGTHQMLITYPASSSFEIYVRNYYNSSWSSWYKVPHTGAGASFAGNVIANAGLLKSTSNGNTVQIGSQNASYCHIYNSADIPFYFNKDVYINGFKIRTIKPSAMSIGHSGRPQLSGTAWTRKLIDLGGVQSSFGDGFEYTSNGIKAKRDMQCLVSATATTWNSTEVEEFDIQIVNTTQSGTPILAQANSNTMKNLMTHTIAPRLVSLAKNDVVKLYFTPGGNGTFTFLGDSYTTTLTIQEV